jgi:hypothetical protein
MSEKTTAWTEEELAAIHQMHALRPKTPAQIRYEEETWEGHHCPIDEHCNLCVDQAWDCGAAVAGGMLLTGIALRKFACRMLHCRRNRCEWIGGCCCSCEQCATAHDAEDAANLT